MSIRKETSLFNGEVIVSHSGLYTFVHYYEHPQNGRQVIMAGMNHEGEEEYFEQIRQILAGCDLVLFEDIRKERDEHRDKDAEEAELREIVLSDTTGEMFIPALQLFFLSIGKALGLPGEAEAFDAEYNQPHWFSGDTLLFSKNQEQEHIETLHDSMASVPLDKKYEVVEHVKRAIQQIDLGAFAKRFIGEGMICFYSDQRIVKAITDVLGVPRDLYCFEEFDRLVSERNPRIVGIKFGAGHITHQRTLLEKRGYVHRRSRKLCNISFKK